MASRRARTESANGGGAGPRLLAPEAVQRALPASPEAIATVRTARERLRAGAGAGSARRLRLVGPERLVDAEAAFRWAHGLRREARERLESRQRPLLVMRTFVEALVRDPLRDGTCDLNLGLATARMLLLRINELGVPCAIEAPGPVGGVNGLAAACLEDLVVWQVRPPLGETQLHRALPQSVLAERR